MNSITTPLLLSTTEKLLKNNSNGYFSSFLCNYPLNNNKEKLMEINNNKNNLKNKNNNSASPQTINEENKLINANLIENCQQKVNVILTIRMLMQGKDVGSIIGKKGDFVKQIRETSGAKINITDGACPERIVTISGTFNAIDLAFIMIARKFEEDIPAPQVGAQKPPITLRLIIPASQCGSLIGKGGSKIREIRDKTGASLQVANEMLSNSTEKAVTISGSSEALIGCMRHVCHILLDSPAKGPTIQYKPLGTNLISSPNNSFGLITNTQKEGNYLLKTQINNQNNLNNVFNNQLLNYPLLQQQILQQQTQKHIVPNNMLIPQSIYEQFALLQQNNQQLNNRFLPSLNLNTQQQQTAALLAAASVLNPTLVASNISNLQEQQNNIGFYKFPQEFSGGLDPVTLALLANQQNGNIDYVSLLAEQKKQTSLDQQQILLQQQHLNNLLFYQQQQSQLQTTVETTTANTSTASVSLPTDSMVLAAALSSRNTGSNDSIANKKKQQRYNPY